MSSVDYLIWCLNLFDAGVQIFQKSFFRLDSREVCCKLSYSKRLRYLLLAKGIYWLRFLSHFEDFACDATSNTISKEVYVNSISMSYLIYKSLISCFAHTKETLNLMNVQLKSNKIHILLIFNIHKNHMTTKSTYDK